MRIRYAEGRDGVSCEAVWCGPDGRRIRSVGVVPYEHVQHVGGRGGGLRSLARKAARSRALRGLGKAAMRVARATPYGRAASAALGVARTALGRGRGSGRASRRPGRAAPRPGPTSLQLSADKRVAVARRLLNSGLRGRALTRALRAVLS